MRHIILWLTLLLSLTACQLSLGSNEVNTPLPAITQPPVTTTRTTPVAQVPTASPTVRPTNTPPKVNTSVPLPSCTRQTTWPSYVVVSGDTLGKIANRTGSDVATLTKANCLANADQISVGQTLYVPRIPTPPTNVPPTAVPATTVPSGDKFIVSTLPTNPGCYLQIYGMIISPNVYSAPQNTASVVATLDSALYYRIYSQTTTHYEIAYTAQGQSGWFDKTFGNPVGNCNVLTQVPANIVTTRYDGIAFDHPANWYSGFNVDGLPGGTLGTIRALEMPTTINGWTTNMVMVGYTVVPDGIMGPNLETAAKEAVENLRQSGRYSIVREATPIKTAMGYDGFFYDYTDTSAYSRVYYLRIGEKNVSFMIQGNITLGDAVLSTLRPA